MFTHAHLHPLSFSQFSQWLHPMIFTNVHRCFTYWMVSKSCTCLNIINKFLTTIIPSIFWVPVHVQPNWFDSSAKRPGLNMGSTAEEITARHPQGSDDLPLLAPIHALVDVAEKVHLKGLKERQRTKPFYIPYIRYTSFEVGLAGRCLFCWGVGWKKCESRYWLWQELAVA